MRTHYIYKATDVTNGMSYIGQTYDMKSRRRLHERCRPEDDCFFHRALQAHGIENFRWEIIDTATSCEEADKKEIEYISTLNTLKPNGYNMRTGGQGGCMWNAKAIVCLTLDGEYVKTYRSARQAEIQDGFLNTSVLLCCKGLLNMCGNRVFMYEKDYLEHGPKKYVKPESARMKRIVQCDLNGNFIKKFKSVTEASRELGILRSRISSSLTGCSKTAGGYIFVYEEDFPIKDISKYKPIKRGRKVAQVDPETGEIIKVFDRMTDAAKEFGGSHKFIHKVCDKPNCKAYGYKWISQ